MPVRFIPELADVVPYEGGPSLEALQRRHGLERVVRLASNEYPLPPFPEVREALLGALDGVNRYPDSLSTDLREALAARHDCRPEEIAVGGGSAELLYLLGQVVLERGDEVVLAAPTFTAYHDVIAINGAVPVAIPLRDHVHDLEAMAAAVSPRTKLLLVCNPNNPTGTYVPAAEVRRLVESVPDEVLVVVDEAYREFVTAEDGEGPAAIRRGHDNVVVLRTFSKIYGLAGLRTGYAVCSPEVREALDKARQPFNVNLLGQVAALEAVRHQERVVERRETNARLRDYLTARLAERGHATVPTQTNFMLVGADGLRRPRKEVCGALLAAGAMVRDGAVLGCPGWMRVTLGSEDEVAFFLEKLDALEVDDQARRDPVSPDRGGA